MSIKVSYSGKTQQFDPNDKVSKVVEKLSLRGALNLQVWTVNGEKLPQLTAGATLLSLGVQAGQEIIIGHGQSGIQQPYCQQIQPPIQINNPPPFVQPPQFQTQPQQAQQTPSNPFASQTNQQPQLSSTRAVPTQQGQQIPQQNINSVQQPQFQAIKIAIPPQKEKSRVPNAGIPQEAEKEIYGFLVKITNQGREVELSKPNNEFKALFLEQNSSKEESQKVILSVNEVLKDPQYSLRIGESKLGGTKVIFLQDGRGIAIQWHSGFSTKCQFWFDE